MSFVAGSIIAKFKSDLSGLQKGIASAKGAVSGLSGSASSLQSKFNGSFSSITSAVGKFGKALGIVGGLVGGISLGALGKQAINTAKDFEQSEIAFTTLLKDRGKALQALQAIQEDAKQTPYNLPELIKVNQMLISAGESADGSRKVIKDLGNAVAATGGGTAELTRLGANLQQIKALGKASALDIKQFGYAGINIYSLLSETTGKTVEEVKEMEVTYETLTEALSKASDAGGMFEGAMENQSKSLQGIMSNIQDTIDLGLKDILVQSGAFDAIKALAEGFLNWFEGAVPKITRFFTVVGNIISYLGEIWNGVDISAELEEALSFFFGDKAGMVAGILTMLVNAFKAFAGFVSQNKDTIVSALKGIALGLGAVMAINGILAIPAMLTAIGTALVALMSPALLVVAGVTLLYMAWSNNWLGIRDITASVWEFLKGVFGWLMNIPEMLQGAWETFKNFFIGVFTAIQPVLQAFWEVVQFVFNAVMAYIQFWANFWKWIFENLVFPILFLLSAIVARVVYEVIKFFGDLATQVGDWMRRMYEEYIQPIVEAIVTKFTELKDMVMEKFNALKSGALGIWNSIKSTLDSIVSSIKESISNKTGEAKTSVLNIFNQLWEGLKSLAGKIYDAITDPFRRAKEAIEKIASEIKEKAMQISPFHKNSPSLVELVQKGTGQIADMYKDLGEQISGYDYHGNVLGLAGGEQPAFAGASNSGPSVNQYITNEVHDGADVDMVNQRLAFMYRNAQR